MPKSSQLICDKRKSEKDIEKTEKQKKLIPINKCKISYRLTVLSSDFSNLLHSYTTIIYLHSQTIRKAIKRPQNSFVFTRNDVDYECILWLSMAVEASTKMRRILNIYINFLDVLISLAFVINILVQLSFFRLFSSSCARKKNIHVNKYL